MTGRRRPLRWLGTRPASQSTSISNPGWSFYRLFLGKVWSPLNGVTSPRLRGFGCRGRKQRTRPRLPVLDACARPPRLRLRIPRCVNTPSALQAAFVILQKAFPQVNPSACASASDSPQLKANSGLKRPRRARNRRDLPKGRTSGNWRGLCFPRCCASVSNQKLQENVKFQIPTDY